MGGGGLEGFLGVWAVGVLQGPIGEQGGAMGCRGDAEEVQGLLEIRRGLGVLGVFGGLAAGGGGGWRG